MMLYDYDDLDSVVDEEVFLSLPTATKDPTPTYPLKEERKSSTEQLEASEEVSEEVVEEIIEEIVEKVVEEVIEPTKPNLLEKMEDSEKLRAAAVKEMASDLLAQKQMALLSELINKVSNMKPQVVEIDNTTETVQQVQAGSTTIKVNRDSSGLITTLDVIREVK